MPCYILTLAFQMHLMSVEKFISINEAKQCHDKRAMCDTPVYQIPMSNLGKHNIFLKLELPPFSLIRSF